MKKQYIAIIVVMAIIGSASISIADKDSTNADRDRQGNDIKTINNAEDQFNSGPQIAINAFEKIYRLFMRLSLPPSLDNVYKGSVPETLSSPYLFEMIKMVGAFEGIIVNVQNNDMTNATISYNQFKKQYKNVSEMVPEWESYFNFDLVNKLGEDLKNNNVPAIFTDINNIGKSCDRCHGNEFAQVWAKYYWRDFDTVNVSTPEGNLSWPEAMPKYLATGFDGITVNAMEGKQKEANDSFNLFKSMLLNFKQACNNCHNTPRYYFVSDDVLKKVDEMGANITANNLNGAIAIQQQLGENCHRCHVIHQPPQRMKDKMKK